MQDKIQIGRFINALPNGDLRRAFTWRLHQLMQEVDSEVRPYTEEVSVDLLNRELEWAKINKGRSLNEFELLAACRLAGYGFSLKYISLVFDISLFSLTVHHGVKLGAIISKYQENKSKLLKSV